MAPTKFPAEFLWGAAVCAHQTEGNNVNSDCWFVENVSPTIFKEPSLTACDSYNRWAEDVDIVKAMGLTAYRFSLEWARIEPSEGTFDAAEIAHYEAIVDRCHELGLEPVLTMNHFVTPHWFASRGGWLNPQAPELFARFCATVVAKFGQKLKYVVTLNEPNLPNMLGIIGLPDFVENLTRDALDAASVKAGVAKYRMANVVRSDEIDEIEEGLAAGHVAAREAMKAIHPHLQIGLSLAMTDEEYGPGGEAVAAAVQQRVYGRWVRLVANIDDFIGVQNYSRNRWGADGKKLPNDPAYPETTMHSEVYPPSLAHCVEWTYAQTNIPVFVTEHGVGTQDDAVRAAFIKPALAELKKVIDAGVPVIGYCHWSLLDNFEWIFGYDFTFGLVSVDRQNGFTRTRKPSSFVLEEVARNRGL